MEKEKDEIDKEEEEKKFLLDYIKKQNEVLKKIYKKAVEKEKAD